MNGRTAISALIATAIVALAGAIFIAPEKAHACSGTRSNPADVIVEGRIWGSLDPGRRAASSATVEVRLDIEKVHRGSVDGDQIVFEDSVSGGSCSAGVSAAAGQYAILGLRRSSDGVYTTSRPLLFSLGDEPGSERFEAALARATRTDTDNSVLLIALGLGALASALLIASLAVKRRANDRV